MSVFRKKNHLSSMSRGLKEINVPFPISSPICHREGRQFGNFFFSLSPFFFPSQIRSVNYNFFFQWNLNILTSLTEHLTDFEYR